MAISYRIVGDDSTYKLGESVKFYIKRGWIPIGGIAIDGSLSRMRYFQAMTKEEEVD